MGKFNNIADLQADDSLLKEGIDLSFGNSRFITVTRTGANNRKYKTVLARIFKPYTSATGVMTASDDEATKLLKEVYAESVVLGWRGFTDIEKKEIPFNKKNCIELFDDAPEIFDIVQIEAAKFSNFAQREVEQAGKE